MLFFEGFDQNTNAKGTLLNAKIIDWIFECVQKNENHVPFNDSAKYQTKVTELCTSLIEDVNFEWEPVEIKEINQLPILFKLLM